LRKAIALVTEYATERKQFGRPLSEFGLIKEKITRLALSTYTMESMAYLTAGMIDSGNYEDCAMEAAMVKVPTSYIHAKCCIDGCSPRRKF
jgi:acyl-CoA dehydrogenase family protein 9